ncbi:helix-turn-helix domain-containing protein [Streptomyces cacaoi]|uniref:helix-turn-helix domain-containing protein n=1 Tax=Streptomyces cacaoi TaxID=1898 RepID=UPI002612D449|nr:helix-turn-helix domain-containing protein [Streptomyces cacaoi]
MQAHNTAPVAGLPNQYLTPEEVARIFKVPLETVYRWRKQRTGPPGFRAGKHLRFDPAAVHAWVAQQTDRDAA